MVQLYVYIFLFEGKRETKLNFPRDKYLWNSCQIQDIFCKASLFSQIKKNKQLKNKELH